MRPRREDGERIGPEGEGEGRGGGKSTCGQERILLAATHFWQVLARDPVSGELTRLVHILQLLSQASHHQDSGHHTRLIGDNGCGDLLFVNKPK